MGERAKKPKGWYGKEAKAARKAERERRRRVRETEGMLREARARRLGEARAEVERHAERLVDKCAETRDERAKADRDYARQAKALARDLQPKLSGVDKGTPHTQRHHRKSSFDRLCDTRCVTGEMLQAAQEIERVYLAICGAVLVRAQTIGTAGLGAPRPMSDYVALAHARHYRPWADALASIRNRGGWPMLEIVIDVVIDGRQLRDVEKDKRLRNGAAKVALCWALLKYAVMARWSSERELAAFEERNGLHRRLATAA